MNVLFLTLASICRIWVDVNLEERIFIITPQSLLSLVLVGINEVGASAPNISAVHILIQKII